MSRPANRTPLRTALYGWALGVGAVVSAVGFAGAALYASIASTPQPALVSSDFSGPALLELQARRLGATLDAHLQRSGATDPSELSQAAMALRARALGLLASEARLGRLAHVALEPLARIASDLGSGGLDVDALAAGDLREMERLEAAIAEHLPAIESLTRAAAEADAALATEAERDAAVSLLALAGAFCCVVMLAASARAIVLSRRARDASAFRHAPPLSAEAACDKQRTEGLAMLSRELRTPLHGVLGSLALVRDIGVNDEQAALLDQAESAGRQLANMLDDVIDAEAEPGAALEKAEAFEIGVLAQSMRDLFAPAAARSGVSFSVHADENAPPLVGGDGKRFQRALSHLCGFVLERAGARDVRLEIGHGDGECKARLSFDLPDPNAGAAELRRIVEAEPGHLSDAGEAGLGPLLAKGLLERIGGRLEVSTSESGRVLVLVAAPAANAGAAQADGPRVRVMAQTRSLGALGAAAASAAGVEVLDADDAPSPDIVLVEAGGDEEEMTVSEARTRWSAALLLALGQPRDASVFDGVVAAPLEPDRVARAVEAAWKRRAALAPN